MRRRTQLLALMIAALLIITAGLLASCGESAGDPGASSTTPATTSSSSVATPVEPLFSSGLHASKVWTAKERRYLKRIDATYVQLAEMSARYQELCAKDSLTPQELQEAQGLAERLQSKSEAWLRSPSPTERLARVHREWRRAMTRTSRMIELTTSHLGTGTARELLGLLSDEVDASLDELITIIGITLTDARKVTEKPPKPSPKPAKSAQPAKWRIALRFDGDSSPNESKSKVFSLKKGSVSVSWATFPHQDSYSLMLSMFPAGASVNSPNFRVLAVPGNTDPESGSRTLQLKKDGKFYVFVIAGNCDWVVTLEQKQ